MNFADAMTAVNTGKPITRAALPKGCAVQQIKTISVNGTALSGVPFVGLVTAQPSVMPWLPNQADMAATDWTVVGS